MEKTDLTKISKEFQRLKTDISQALTSVDRNSHTYLQNYIYFAHHPIFSFTESILLLCENGKSNAANVLLRTLFEVHIDVIYHQLGDSKARLAYSAKRMFDERITVLEEISNLILKYPNLESKNPNDLFSKEYLVSAIAEQKSMREGILKANPNLSGEKHLQRKARLCEEGKVNNAEKGNFERMYSLIYRQLSPLAHLNIEGLQAFIKLDKHGSIYFHDGDDEDFIATQALDIAVAFCKDLYDNKIIVGEQIKVINEVEILISEMNKKFQ